MSKISCNCCNKTRFGTEAEELAQESHWKEKYKYKDNANLEKIKWITKKILELEGIDKLHQFNHFLIWRYKLTLNNPIYSKETKENMANNIDYTNSFAASAMKQKQIKEQTEMTERYQKIYARPKHQIEKITIFPTPTYKCKKCGLNYPNIEDFEDKICRIQ